MGSTILFKVDSRERGIGPSAHRILAHAPLQAKQLDKLPGRADMAAESFAGSQCRDNTEKGLTDLKPETLNPQP